jgi:hypothetical protein
MEPTIIWTRPEKRTYESKDKRFRIEPYWTPQFGSGWMFYQHGKFFGSAHRLGQVKAKCEMILTMERMRAEKAEKESASKESV